MHARDSALHYVGRLQLGQALEPQTCRLGLAVSMLPRLDDLIRLADGCADPTDGVLECNARDVALHQR